MALFFSFAEGTVLCHFIVLALLWLTREPEFVPGWGSLMPNKSVADHSDTSRHTLSHRQAHKCRHTRAYADIP